MTHLPSNIPLFPLGFLAFTMGAKAACEEICISPLSIIRRHVFGDWASLCESDREQNLLALACGNRIFSVYYYEKIKFYVITEADRSITTLLLAEEY